MTVAANPRYAISGSPALWLAGLLLALLQAPGAPQAAEELQRGELSIQVDSGYAGFAFPIANAALARRWSARASSETAAGSADWAGSGLLAYQLGYDYSTIPVHVRIMHRRPEVFSGRIEVVSAHGYHNSEVSGGGFTAVAHSFIAPPSQPVEFTLAPRVCPPSKPGQAARLLVKMYAANSARPYKVFEQKVIQLEPAHLYSLLLDAPPTTIITQQLNAGNRLHFDTRGDLQLDPAIYSSQHYLFGCEHAALTGLPLAARQFAFAVADYPAVAAWSAADQAALATFCVGGGRLLLYNAPPGGAWQGLQLDSIRPVGRGWLLCEPRGLPAALPRVQSWLEGELAELVLTAGGTVGGVGIPPATFSSLGDSGLDLAAVYGIPEVEPGSTVAPLSHRAGFLHPLWLSRLVEDGAAIEPWDYPEFKNYPGALVSDNLNLGLITFRLQRAGLPRTLSIICGGTRRLPGWWEPGLALGLAALAFAALASPAWRRGYGLPALTCCVAAGLGLSTILASGSAPSRPTVNLSLLDCDAGLAAAAERRVTARMTDAGAEAELPLPPASLIRRVDREQAGPWQAEALPATADAPARERWIGSGGAPYVALRTDNPATAPAGIVRLEVLRRTAQGIDLELATPGVPAGQLLLVQSSAGWQALTSGKQPQFLHLQLGDVPLAPGLDRLRAQADLVTRRNVPFGPARNPQTAQASRMLNQLLDNGWSAELRSSAPDADLQRLGWLALLQNPLLGRGMPVGQVVVYCVAPPAENERAAAARSITWLRWCVALPPGGAGP